MVRPRIRQSTDTVVAIAEQLDPQAAVLVGQLIEAGVEIVEQLDQLLCVAFGGEHGEALNVGEQNAVERNGVPVHTMQILRGAFVRGGEEDRSGCISDLKISKI